MHANVGTLDRLLRVVLGIALIALAWIGSIPAWLGWIGLIPLLTGVVRTCPLYSVLGIRTRRRSNGRLPSRLGVGHDIRHAGLHASHDLLARRCAAAVADRAAARTRPR